MQEIKSENNQKIDNKEQKKNVIANQDVNLSQAKPTNEQSTSTNNNLQQPHLGQEPVIKKQKISKTTISFIIAILTIALTIGIGVYAAKYLKEINTEKQLPSKNPEITIIPTQKPIKPIIEEDVSEEKESTSSDGFQNILQNLNESETTSTEESTSTKSPTTN